MAWWGAMLWGAFGGLFVVLAELVLTQKDAGRPPWSRREVPDELRMYILALLARLVIGAGLAAAVLPDTAIEALGLGVGAPLVAERLSAIACALLPAAPAAPPVQPSYPPHPAAEASSAAREAAAPDADSSGCAQPVTEDQPTQEAEQ